MKAFYKNEKTLIFYFNNVYPKNSLEVLSSEAFETLMNSYIENLKELSNSIFLDVLNLLTIKEWISFFKVLITFKIDEAKALNNKYKDVIDNRETLYEIVEDFYDFWRSHERFSVNYSKERKSFERQSFITSNEMFSNTVIGLYRDITEKLSGKPIDVYRQVPAGINAGIMLEGNHWAKNYKRYNELANISFISTLLIRPPFMYYSKKNTRKGTFLETNQLDLSSIDKENWLCYPAYVGESLTYFYFNRDYLNHAVALANLFEFVDISKCYNKKPDCICLFGLDTNGEPRYYYDNENDIYVGICPYGIEIDYFGYVKKMMLTIHNVRMIKKGYLPIHGAGVRIRLKNGNEKIVALVGDSGAGKSETLEALKAESRGEILTIQTIFDDMGYLKIENDNVYAYGTEIGAFVRLDDLESGYVYKQMDRAIFINPNKVNARLVIPVSTYKFIQNGYKLDMILNANNYSKDNTLIRFDDINVALNAFKSGKRMAKGTTSESGIVETYFANPFGPVQNKEKCEVLLDEFFKKFYDNNLYVGELYTKLGVPGFEKNGPKEAAKYLLDLLLKEKA